MKNIGGGAIVFVIIIAAAFMVANKDKTENKNLENNQNIQMTNTNNPIATFVTNQGTFKIELFADKAPKTVENFKTLANQGFYNQTKFHRIIPDFMNQGGDPLTKDDAQKMRWGTGDPGYKFSDEFGVGLSNVKGTISMANSGPNTNGSQFFINVVDNIFLDGKHAVFGNVIEGMDIVMKINVVETGERDVPVSPVIIESVEVK